MPDASDSYVLALTNLGVPLRDDLALGDAAFENFQMLLMAALSSSSRVTVDADMKISGIPTDTFDSISDSRLRALTCAVIDSM